MCHLVETRQECSTAVTMLSESNHLVAAIVVVVGEGREVEGRFDSTCMWRKLFHGNVKKRLYYRNVI